MKRRSRAGLKRAKTRRRKTVTQKRSDLRDASTADHKTQSDVAQLVRERDEALERQTATSEILSVISKSLSDPQPVFDAIVQSGLKLFPGAALCVALREENRVKAAAVGAPDSAGAEAWRGRFPNPLAREHMHGRAILARRVVDIPDARD